MTVRYVLKNNFRTIETSAIYKIVDRLGTLLFMEAVEPMANCAFTTHVKRNVIAYEWEVEPCTSTVNTTALQCESM